MNNQTQSPLLPQGSLLEQKNKGRTRMRIAVSIVLAVHGVGLLALLLQGCQKEKETPQPPPPSESATTPTNQPPAFTEPTNPPSVETPTPPPVPPAPPQPAAGAQDYKIAAGDTFSGLAAKFHVTVPAIVTANPGVDPNKLQIGQTIHIPAPVVKPAPAVTPGTATLQAGPGEQIYTVKSGDTLGGIAKQFGTTVRAIQSANNLKTTSIKVGDKLKIPVKAAPSAPAPAESPAPAAGTPPSSR